MRRSVRGFWLSEVLTSLWLITFVAAGLLGLFVYLAKTSKIANERAAADLLADRVLERAVRMGPPDWGLAPGEAGQRLQIAEGDEGKPLHYRLTGTALEDHRLGKLFLLEVEVSWAADPNAPAGVERGRGELIRDRHVYIEDLSDETEVEETEEEPPAGG